MPERGTRTLWSVDVEVFSPDPDLNELWMELPDHVGHERLEQLVEWGTGDEDEGLYADAHMLLWATSEGDARDLAERLLCAAITQAPKGVRDHPELSLRLIVEQAPKGRWTPTGRPAAHRTSRAS